VPKFNYMGTTASACEVEDQSREEKVQKMFNMWMCDMVC